jgi:hypothetical protein
MRQSANRELSRRGFIAGGLSLGAASLLALPGRAAVRMHDVGAIKNSPQQTIAQGTDFRFVNDLKRELKV